MFGKKKEELQESTLENYEPVSNEFDMDNDDKLVLNLLKQSIASTDCSYNQGLMTEEQYKDTLAEIELNIRKLEIKYLGVDYAKSI